MSDLSPSENSVTTRGRRWKFRLAAVGLGLSVFVLFELVCRAAGWGQQAGSGGHVAEMAAVRPLFVPTADELRYRIADNRREYFADESFDARKKAGEFRVFVIGGSTVQGRPFSTQTAFARCLEMSLQQAASDITWRVINCGGISYASYRLVPIVEECLGYQPDLIIVCTGHNEYLEFITYAQARRSQTVVTAYRLLDRLHSFRLLETGLSCLLRSERPSSDAVRLPEEVDAVLDHQGGLQAYRRSALDRATVESGFHENLNRLVDLVREADVPLILVRPPTNLADCPPFKSEFAADLSPSEQDDFLQQLSLSAEKLSRGDLAGVQSAVAELTALTAIDPGYALVWYQLGRACLNARQMEQAARAFARAADEDICPLRMTSALEAEMRQVVADRGVPFLDAHQLLTELSRHGIADDSVLVDHVHPSFQSHLEIAFGLADLMQQSGWLTTSDSQWKPSTRAEFAAHLQSLDDMYYLRGRQMLDVLKAWAAGRADGSPLQVEPDPAR